MKKFWIILGVIAVVAALGATITIAANKAPTINFLNKTYTLKWSNQIAEGSYSNEYLTDGENFDNYHTMVTVQEYAQAQDQKDVAMTLYSLFKNSSVKDIKKINDEATYLNNCAVLDVPQKHVECSFYNIQNRKDTKNVVVFMYTTRYYTSEIANANEMTKMMMNDITEVQKQIGTVQIPNIVKKIIDAPSSYVYGVKTK